MTSAILARPGISVVGYRHHSPETFTFSFEIGVGALSGNYSSTAFCLGFHVRDFSIGHEPVGRVEIRFRRSVFYAVFCG
jgi:hypothetical protein